MLQTPLVIGALAATTFAQGPTFAPPVRLQAGAALLGQHRLYPSPVLHDLDGDGLVDVVVGDLRGRLTVAPRTAKSPATFGTEQKVMAANGKELDFANW